MRVRGLKYKCDQVRKGRRRSHPMRVRGLKFREDNHIVVDCLESHPMRVRGLKLEVRPQGDGEGGVAPHAGAWIEMPHIS